MKPNILFILLDDLGKEWVDVYGAEGIELPNVTELARTGMQFKNAYSMPQCTPSRVALMTGQYPFRNGWINHWDVPRWGAGCHFDWRRNPCVARILKEAGYRTAAAGKWQVNDFRVHPDAMTKHGFDDYCMWTGYETGNDPSANRYWDPYIHTKDGSKTYEGQFGEDIFSDFLIDFMRENQDEPMFLYYPMCLPHTPFTTTPLEPDAEGKYERHEAMVRYIDHILGKMIDALEELGLRENTIVIWTTDNGTTGQLSNRLNGREVQGGKQKTTENGICAPFIVNCPGLVPEGVVSDALVDFSDMLLTFADMADAELPVEYGFDGVSVADVFLGEAEDSERECILGMGGQNRAKVSDVGVENEWRFRDRVIRDKQYKLFIDTDRQPEKLVDIINDPDEEVDISDSEDPDVQAAREKLEGQIPLFPRWDNDPKYVPQPPQEWDVPVTVESKVWKKK
ncbi:MAG: sulfatase-like hydrolase/transferase [Planctomycetes bacterium]|nr:sulfatase-like hydrolase/transferase [Planctomycetota bacterium]